MLFMVYLFKYDLNAIPFYYSFTNGLAPVLLSDIGLSSSSPPPLRFLVARSIRPSPTPVTLFPLLL